MEVSYIMEIEKIVRVAIWIAFIMLAFLSVHYKYDACNVCKLEYGKEKLDGSQFFNAYAGKCLVKKAVYPGLEDYKSLNITFIKP